MPSFPDETHEKAGDLENGATGTDSSSYRSDLGTGELKQHGPTDVLDSEHEDMEDIQKERVEDIERQSMKLEPIKSGTGQSTNESNIERSNSLTLSKTKSKISRIATNLTSKSKREKLQPPKIPVSDLDNGIVGWESQDDPEMPLNFPESRKWLLLSLISSITIISPLASSMFAPAVSFMDKDFNNNSPILSSLTVSIFVCGYVIGPLILAPLCEIYGRRYVLAGANVFFCIWQIGCALAPNLVSLIIFRLLAGIGGAGCLTIGGGVISDLFPPDRRGVATSLYSCGPLLGPVLGPICGGFIAQRVGWRWVFWVLLIAGTVLTVGIEFFNSETNHQVLVERKTIRLRKELDRPELRSCYVADGPARSSSQIFAHGIIRPMKMLFGSLIIFLLSLYMAVVYGLLYLLFTTMPGVFTKTYDWDPDISGLAYIGLGVGFLLGIVGVVTTSDRVVVKMTKANNGVFEPEMRLPMCVFFACFIPITFFWYGWSADQHVHWIVTIIGLIPFSFGMIGIFIPVQTYLIDSFPTYAASGVAALTVSRSLFGAFLPLAGPSMYATLGLGWGNSLLGFVAIALIPVPVGLYKYGAMIRTKYPIKL